MAGQLDLCFCSDYTTPNRMTNLNENISKHSASYGWVITTIAFVSIMAGAAIRNSMIVLYPPILAEFGWSRTTLSLASSVAGFTLSACTLLIGIMSDRWDLRKIIPIGASLAVAGLLLCRTITRPWQIYLYFGVVTSLGASTMGMLPYTIVISNWFSKKRGTAIGIVTSSFGISTILFVPLMQFLIGSYGWRSVYILLALLVGAVVIPLNALFMRSRPRDQVTEPAEARPPTGRSMAPREPDSVETGTRGVNDEAQDLKRFLLRLATNRRFWFTYAQFILGPLSTTPVIIHQAVFFADQGLDAMASAWIVAVYGMGVFFSMLLSGFLSDRLTREVIYSLGTACLVAGCTALLLVRPGTGLVLPMLYAIFFGLGFGTRPSMDAATATDIFRGDRFGLVYGLLSTGLGIGQFLGPVLGGFIFDRSGSYTDVFLFCLVAVNVATFCIWMSGPRKGRARVA